MIKNTFLIFILTLISIFSKAQNNNYILGFKDSSQVSVSLKFKMINNLVIIPLRINNSDSLFFILDSGVNPTILTNSDLNIPFQIGRESKISGLGQDNDLTVIQTFGNKINIADEALLTLQNVFIVTEERFELSKKMGTRIDGIIGGAIFENYVVKINYDRKKITLIKPEKFKEKKYKRWLRMPIELYNKKPYIRLKMQLCKDTIINANLLFDLGASDALWLLQNTNDSIIYKPKEELYYLGQGINGDIYGYFDKIQYLFFSQKIYLKNIQVSKPDTNSLQLPEGYDIEGRNGTIGSEIIKRFNVVIDYKRKQIFFRKNSLFSSKYSADLSGLQLDAPYQNLNLYEVYYVQKNSPAYEAGLIKGDILLNINNVPVLKYSLNEMNLIFRTRIGKKLKIEYNRDGKIRKTVLILRDYRFD